MKENGKEAKIQQKEAREEIRNQAYNRPVEACKAFNVLLRFMLSSPISVASLHAKLSNKYAEMQFEKVARKD